MNHASKPDSPIDERPSALQPALVKERFELAWKFALSGPPRVDEFLVDIVEPERSRLLGEMEQLDQQYRLLWDSRADRAAVSPARAGGTVDYQPVVSVAAVAPQASPVGRGDSRPEKGTPGPAAEVRTDASAPPK